MFKSLRKIYVLTCPLTKNLLKVEISQHIKDLLFVHDRVVLPGFGAFVAKYSPAAVDKSTNTISPPSKEITFDAESRKSSGLLEKYMADKESITADDARAQIDEFVKTVISKLKAGKKVKFAELGTFALGKDNVISFLYEPAGNLLLDSYGLSKISLPENVAPAEIDKGSDGEKRKKRGWIIPVAAVVVLALLLTGVYFLKRDWWNRGTTYVTQVYNNITTKSKPDDADTDDSHLADIKDMDETDVIDDNTVIDETDDSNLTDNTTVTPDETDGTKPDDKVKPEDKKNVTPGKKDTPVSSDDNSYTGQYKVPEKGKSYLIIGSVNSAKAAEAEKARFEKKGINVEILPSGGNRFRLSAGTFTQPNDAVAFYNDFNAKHKGVNGWLWENK